ncbi:MAG: MFS transporter [Cellvibrionaceae bacterium]
MTPLDPRQTIASNPMSRLQIIVVALTIGLNALDGFDVLAISFASPGISSEWGIDRAALGIVLSMELIGMCIGSIFLGGVADKIGRRPTILGCLVVMSAGMFLATTATNVYQLSAWRVLTGLGIGGMLASINAVTAEFSNNKRRHMNVSLMTIGYPIGAVIGGMITAQLLKVHDWRSVFYFGSAVTVMFIPLVYFLIPESVHWLSQKQPNNALENINRTLARLKIAAISALPVVTEESKKKSIGDIFTTGLLATTIIVTAAYFFHITTFYFILKWVPKIVVDMGFPASSAAGVLVWANLGGALGGALFGLLTLRFSVKWLSIGVMFLSTILVSLIGKSSPDLQSLSIICAIAGFCTNAGVVGLYAIFAHSFPTHVRAFGTGFAIGIGRGGAVIAPILAGFLFATGFELPIVSIIMALGSTIAACALLFLKMRSTEESTSS